MRTARTRSALRTSALIALGAFAVHQLRYLVAYGGDAGAALGAQGHAYLTVAAPPLVIVATSAVLGTLVAAALSTDRAASHRRAAGWAFCSAALLAVFGVQELVEGMLASGHAGGMAAVTARGGWIAVPIAVAVGRVVSYLLGSLDVVERGLTRRSAERPRRRAIALPPLAPRVFAPLARRPLAFGLARRPPPAPAA
jgi:hypothetical protein